MILLLLAPLFYFLLKDILKTIRSYFSYRKGFEDGVRGSTHLFKQMKYNIEKHPDYLKIDLIAKGMVYYSSEDINEN